MSLLVWKADMPPVRWHDQPHPASFTRAQRELDRLNVPGAAQAVHRLQRGKVETVPAAVLIRQVTGRALPDVSAGRVRRETDRIRSGKRLRPVLVVGNTIADGEHRLARFTE